ncbi:MAG TPA: M20/M25/M40 family metallo-hydrolase [Pirellulales bacterium]|nr:M20/M25/M40 family metallo-hydrolase [Pirellulales bacterium]
MSKCSLSWLLLVLAPALIPGARGLEAADAATTGSLREAITVAELQRHVQVLSDDTFEGREAGSRGGRAAAGYIGREFQRHKLAGGGTAGGYYQSFGAQYRNILGLLEGADPQLKDELIVIGAHYDHVGYGTAQNSYGPTGYIHNGADDNASGVAGLLEMIKAFSQLETRPKRSILFAHWDGEEKGLLGSKHWVAEPTLPLARVRLMVNIDMIGRLRNDYVEVYGSRTGRDLRRLVSLQNVEPNLRLGFSWTMREDSDHYSFYLRGIPVLMFHTGLHDDYHRPSDDVEKLNLAGMQRVARLLCGVLYELADRPQLSGFRHAGRTDTEQARQAFERPLAPLAGRLGLAWDPAAERAGQGLRVSRVAPGSGAEQGGLRPGDRIVRFNGQEVQTGADLRPLVWTAASPAKVAVERGTVERGTVAELVELNVPLGGAPVRLGFSWRTDPAEPHAAVLCRVVPDSVAAQAGLRQNDRVYEVSGRTFDSSDEFKRLLASSDEPIELLVERQGRLQTVALSPQAAEPNSE